MKDFVKKLFVDQFANVGKAIKVFTIVMLCIECFVTVIGGIALIAVSESVGVFFLMLIAVPVAWLLLTVLNWFLYGYGDLIDRSIETANYSKDISEYLKNSKITENQSTDNELQTGENEAIEVQQEINSDDKLQTDAYFNLPAEKIFKTSQDDEFVKCKRCGSVIKKYPCRKCGYDEMW